MSRRALDFYETPEWQTRALLRRQQIAGRVFECCVGDGSLARALGPCATNDIDSSRPADFHLDAAIAESWGKFPGADWVVTNPPFKQALPILEHAHKHAAVGVALLLRISFMEPTESRAPFLCVTPPHRQIVLPRWSYKNNGQTDSVTTAWFIWFKQWRAFEVVTRAEIDL